MFAMHMEWEWNGYLIVFLLVWLINFIRLICCLLSWMRHFVLLGRHNWKTKQSKWIVQRRPVHCRNILSQKIVYKDQVLLLLQSRRTASNWFWPMIRSRKGINHHQLTTIHKNKENFHNRWEISLPAVQIRQEKYGTNTPESVPVVPSLS